VRFWNWLAPTAVTGWVRAIAWLNLVGNVVIIGTGGTVRLTGSGLGCTTWPLCQEGTADWHSVVEFSNRGMGAVLGVLGILAVLAVWRLRRSRRGLWAHAWVLFGGVVVEGLLGAVSVYTDLNVWFVGIHFVLSAALVAVATSFVLRARRELAPRELAIPRWLHVVTQVTTLLLLLVVIGGVLTTAHGPHSGDENVFRDETGWDVFVHVHAYLGYALAAALILLVLAAFLGRAPRFGWAAVAVLIGVGLQIAVGILQADLGLPPALVGIHMVLAAIVVALAVVLVDSARRPVAAASN